jgi:transcriptional regulator with XRE-family HTH domain
VGETLDGLSPQELFGRAVRFVRRLRRVRQVDLAARAGVSLGRLSAIEAGKYNAWLRAAHRLAQALDFADALELIERAYGQDLPAREGAALRAALAQAPPPGAPDDGSEED